MPITFFPFGLPTTIVSLPVERLDSETQYQGDLLLVKPIKQATVTQYYNNTLKNRYLN